MSVGQKIKELRIKQGLTQSDLAAGIVTPSMISLIESERAKPSEKVLRALSERLGVSFDDITAGDSSDWEQASTVVILQSLLAAKQLQAAKEFLLSLPQDSVIPGNIDDFIQVECYAEEGKTPEALEILLQLEEIYQSDAATIFQVWTQMARLYSASGNVELASHYWKKAFQTCIQDPTFELQEIVDCIREMCLFFLEEERYDEVLRVLGELRSCRDFPADMRELAKSYLQDALTFRERKQYRVSSIRAHRSYTLLKNINLFAAIQELQVIESMCKTPSVDQVTGQHLAVNDRLSAQVCLRNGNLDQAYEHANRLVQEARTLNQKALALQILSKVFEQRGDYVQAANTIKEQIVIWEQLGSLEKVAKSYMRLSHIMIKASENLQSL